MDWKDNKLLDQLTMLLASSNTSRILSSLMAERPIDVILTWFATFSTRTSCLCFLSSGN